MHYKHTRNNYSTQRAINRTLSLESLEDRRLLAFVPSTVIVADDAPARFVPSHPVVANGFRALTGEEAADFQVPDDMRLVQSYKLRTWCLSRNVNRF